MLGGAIVEIYAILKEDIMGNIHVKLYEIWTSGSGDVCLFVLFDSLLPINNFSVKQGRVFLG